MSCISILDKLTIKYQELAKTSENWVHHLQAHGLANRSLALEFSEEKQKRVYQIEDNWYKGRHPLSYEDHQTLTKKYLDILKHYRKETKDDFDSINTSYLKLDSLSSEQTQLESFSTSVFERSQNCCEKFISISKEFMQSSVEILSKAGLKVPCSFAVVGLGSVARGTATPYSDLEYAFVVESDNHMDYFTKLAMDTYFRIGNMKESPLKGFNITEVGKSFTDIGAVGFRIDGISKNAGNIPTGKGDGDKNLILTVDEFVSLYSKTLASPAGDIADIADLLSSIAVIYTHGGGDKLFNSLLEKFQNILTEQATQSHMIEKRLNLLTTDIQSYQFLPKFTSFGPPDNTKLKVKADIFRYPTILADHIRLLIALHEATPWRVHLELERLKFIGRTQRFNLNLISALAIYIRTHAYLQLETQYDQLSLYLASTESTSKSIYHLPRDWFMLLAYLFIPFKLSIRRNMQIIKNQQSCKSHNILRQLLDRVTLHQLGFTWRVEVEYFCGAFEKALNTIYANCEKEIFLHEPENFLNIMQTSANRDLTQFSLQTVSVGDLNDKTNYLEMAAYLLYSCRSYEFCFKYFKWLARNSEYSLSDRLKWKVLAADSANHLHEYQEVFSLLNDVCTAIRELYHLKPRQTLYRFIKEQVKTSKNESDELFETVAQAFRVTSSAHRNVKNYLQAEEIASTAISLFDSLHSHKPRGQLGSHYVDMVVSLALVRSENGEHDEGIKCLEHHLAKLLEVHTNQTNHPDIALLLSGLGQLHENMHNFELSLSFYTKALAMTKSLHFDDHFDVAQCYRQIAALQVKMLEYDSSWTNYKTALDLFERLNINDYAKADLLVEIGYFYCHQHKHASALVYLASAQRQLKSKENSHHINVAELNTAYGKVYSQLGESELALQHHATAIEITNKVLCEVEKHPVFQQFYGEMGKFSMNLVAKAKLLNIEKACSDLNSISANMALCYLRVGRVYHDMCLHDQALMHVEKSCEMYKKVYAEKNHSDISKTYNELGCLYANTGKYNRALEAHEKCLSITLSIYGHDAMHADVATTYHNIGSVNCELGNFTASLESYQKALDMRHAAYGSHAVNAEIAVSYSSISVVYSKIGEYSKALAHSKKALNMYLDIYGCDGIHEKLAISHSNVGNAYRDMAEYQEALSHHQKSLDITLAVYGRNAVHIEIAVAYNNLAQLYCDYIGDYNKALEHYELSLEMRLAIFGNEAMHPKIAAIYSNIGTVYRHKSEYNKSLEYLLTSLDMTLAIYGKDANHPDISMSYNNIALVYQHIGKYRKALDYFQKSLKMALDIYGCDALHSDVATIYNNIGSLYDSLGKYERAIEFFTKSLSLEVAINGGNEVHANTATSYNNIGNVYESMSDYKNALKYSKKSLEIKLALYGDNAKHADIASSYNNLGCTNNAIGNYKSALDYHTKCLNMRLAIYGSDAKNFDIAVSYNNIGFVYNTQGRYIEALEYYSKFIDIALAVYGQDALHQDIAVGYSNIGNVHRNMGNYSKALEYLQNSLNMKLAVYGIDAVNADIATTYNNVALTYHKLAHYSSSLKAYRKALEMYKAAYGERANHSNIANSYSNIGDVYADLGEYTTSLHYHILSLDMIKAIYGDKPNHVVLFYNFYKIGRLYHIAGQYNQSQHYFKMALIQRAESKTANLALYRKVLITLSHTLIKSSKYKQAKIFLLLALKHTPIDHCKDTRASIYYFLGQCYLHLQQYTKCWKYLYSALCCYDSLPSSNLKTKSLAQVHLYVSYLLLHLGHVSQSLEHSHSALELMNEILADKENATHEDAKLHTEVVCVTKGLYSALSLPVAV